MTDREPYWLRSLLRAATNAYATTLFPNECVEAVAEIERLRAEASYLRACVPPTRPTDYGHEVWTETVRDAVGAERAAVVAYLRELGAINAMLSPYLRVADDIENGEHRREETE